MSTAADVELEVSRFVQVTPTIYKHTEDGNLTQTTIPSRMVKGP